MREIVIPAPAASVLRTLESAGHEAYAVGGCCRDALLGREPQDWDICTDAPPEAVLALFENSIPTGLKHGTVTVRAMGELLEVTTFRIDGDYNDHRRPDEVTFTSSLREDLSRRDFTMNALACNLRGEIIDLFGGRSDISSGLIRCVGDPYTRFSEDALRMLRAIRFSAQLGFRLDDELVIAAKKLSGTVNLVAAERVYTETAKALLSPAPEKLALGIELGLYDSYLNCSGSLDLDFLSSVPADAPMRFSALCASLKRAGYIASAEKFLRKLKAPAAIGRAVSAVLDPKPVWEREDGLVAIAAAVGRERAMCAAAAMIAYSSICSIEKMRDILSARDCLSVSELDISGNDLIELGLSGKAVGRGMQALLKHVLAHPEDNKKDKLIALAKKNATCV